VRDLVELDPEEIAAIDLMASEHLPFGVTPFYLSLVDRDRTLGFDRSIRAQVLPPPAYARLMTDAKDLRGQELDFMGEGDTSPVDLITRRYPRIAILKPFNTCAQICVYCQRNWEIDECMAPNAEAPADRLTQAVDWLAAHPEVGEVLVTGGDPAILPDRAIERILARLAALPHVYRIRLGTRTPVVLPQRWSGGLASKLARYHEPGRREVTVVTHFQHPYEIGPEAMAAVQSIRRRGLSVYNQQVFTHYNSRRFESSSLRLALRSIGVDPYYVFNMKGKEETADYRVPIARLLQERKEEARLLPGLDRTDEPVFNVPRLGKNHLRLWQDHRLLGFLPDGRRVLSFHPWEKYISLVEPYVFTDVAIFDYLQRLAHEGENLKEYWSIWYYF
jgi:lysine 2,3-aminomutase